MDRYKEFPSGHTHLPSSVPRLGYRKRSLFSSVQVRRRVEKEQEFWIHGQHATLAALANPERCCWRLLVTAARAGVVTDVMARAQVQGCNLPTLEIVSRTVIEVIVPGTTHQGMVLQVSPLASLSIETVIARAAGCAETVVVVLDQVTDPHNVGAVLRSAAAFGALAVVMQERHAPMETGTLARAASGGLERVALARVVNLTRALETLKTSGFWVIGLEAAALLALPHAEISGRIALVLGSEGRGLRRLVRAHCNMLLRLPMIGTMESLNVSNAAAVALYEITRPRLSEGFGINQNLTSST